MSLCVLTNSIPHPFLRDNHFSEFGVATMNVFILLLHMYTHTGDFPDGSVIKNLLAKTETQVQSLGWDDPLEKERATHSSVLDWKTSWTEKPSRLQSMGF